MAQQAVILEGPARDDRGSVTAWLVVTPVLLLVLGGIAADLWGALSARSRIAAIADDAAVAGATAVAPSSVRAADQALALDPAEAVARATAAVDAHPEAHLVAARTASATDVLVGVTVVGRYDPLLLGLVGAGALEVRVTGHATPSVGP